jgi:hypothetical protein
MASDDPQPAQPLPPAPAPVAPPPYAPSMQYPQQPQQPYYPQYPIQQPHYPQYPPQPQPQPYPVYPPFQFAPEARRTALSGGFIIASVGALAALAGFLLLPFVELPFYTPTGMQVAGLGIQNVYFYAVPLGALAALLFAGWQVFMRRPAANGASLVTILAAITGLAPYIYVLARLLADPSLASYSIGNTTISTVSLFGAGFWVPLVGLLAAVAGAFLAFFE